MASELIVDFSTHRDRSLRSIQFAETMEMYIVDRHHDNEDVDRRDLWYNRSDYSRMRLVVKKSVRKVRAMDSAGVPVIYSGNDDGSSDDCLIGIEHLLTQACVFEVKACRRRCPSGPPRTSNAKDESFCDLQMGCYRNCFVC
jgi:hypothetical protein